MKGVKVVEFVLVCVGVLGQPRSIVCSSQTGVNAPAPSREQRSSDGTSPEGAASNWRPSHHTSPFPTETPEGDEATGGRSSRLGNSPSSSPPPSPPVRDVAPAENEWVTSSHSGAADAVESCRRSFSAPFNDRQVNVQAKIAVDRVNTTHGGDPTTTALPSRIRTPGDGRERPLSPASSGTTRLRGRVAWEAVTPTNHSTEDSSASSARREATDGEAIFTARRSTPLVPVIVQRTHGSPEQRPVHNNSSVAAVGGRRPPRHQRPSRRRRSVLEAFQHFWNIVRRRVRRCGEDTSNVEEDQEDRPFPSSASTVSSTPQEEMLPNWMSLLVLHNSDLIRLGPAEWMPTSRRRSNLERQLPPVPSSPWEEDTPADNEQEDEEEQEEEEHVYEAVGPRAHVRENAQAHTSSAFPGESDVEQGARAPPTPPATQPPATEQNPHVPVRSNIRDYAASNYWNLMMSSGMLGSPEISLLTLGQLREEFLRAVLGNPPAYQDALNDTVHGEEPPPYSSSIDPVTHGPPDTDSQTPGAFWMRRRRT